MPKSLVIVESPAKVKTINRYLGEGYIVRSSRGHVRDLPQGGRGDKAKLTTRKKTKQPAAKSVEERKARVNRQFIARLGVDPDDNWNADYEILPDKANVVAELKRLAASAPKVFLATDMDREGEAIAWHIKEVIGGDDSRYCRVIFNEITSNAIKAAFDTPAALDMDKVNAQQTRRFLDRIVGFKLSPLLWSKVARGLSAGRVQSVAVRLIVEREREIRAFIPVEYWEVFTNLIAIEEKGAKAKKDKQTLKFEVVKYQDKKFRPNNESDAAKAVEVLKKSKHLVTNVELKKDKNNRPGPAFITSTLQQAASTRLGFSVKRTMTLAQKLYEAGHITYMRTDSTRLSNDAIANCRKLILKSFGERYLPAKPIIYKSKKQAQEAHEAIRPSDADRRPGALPGMNDAANRLYDLIWQQFVACQMPPAEYDLTTVTVTAGDYTSRIYGRIQRFDGYQKVKPPTSKNEEDRQLPAFKKDTELQLDAVLPIQHFTKPPSRYREASLVQKLEKCSIGRPSTYASIISTIQDRGYASLQNKRFYAEKIGELVTDRLVENFAHLMDYGFTAELEGQLDCIADGKMQWRTILNEFYEDLNSRIAIAEQPEAGMRKNTPTKTDIKCQKCGRNMALRIASTGVFLGCEGYELPLKERCKQTIGLTSEDAIASVDKDEERESKLLRVQRRCGICQATMSSYLVDEQHKLHVCSNHPNCPKFEIEEGSFKIHGHDKPLIDCDKCGKNMQLENGRFGKYFKCLNDECANTRKLMKNGQPAPPKMTPVDMPELKCQKVNDTYVLRDGLAGLFLAAKGFPKNRETRAPLVKELLPYKDKIDKKYWFLLAAPVEDSAGNSYSIKFSRKNSEHYISSTKDGKKIVQTAFYRNNLWQEKSS